MRTAVQSRVYTELQNTDIDTGEAALSALTDRCDIHAIHSTASRWLAEVRIKAHHGTRLTADERASVKLEGLVPLNCMSRAARISRALSTHDRWPEVSSKLPAALQKFGPGEQGGCREGQTHFTVSRFQLIKNHDVHERGSEFDRLVAHDLLGEEGECLVATDGTPTIVTVCIPGDKALVASHIREANSGVPPPLLIEVLKRWSYWLARPSCSASDLPGDCELLFRYPVPASWILSIDILR